MGIESTTTRHPDGTLDVVQRAPAARAVSPAELQRLYWSEVHDVTFGLVRFARGGLRLFGLWPALIRFGPLSDGTRPIVGGIVVRRGEGHIRWSAENGRVEVAVVGFAPLLTGPLWRLESWFHEVVGRRFLARAARQGR